MKMEKSSSTPHRHPGEFAQQLRVMVCAEKFVLDDALALSDLIHEAENEGYSMSETEMRMWKKLGVKIEQELLKHNP